MRPGYRWLVDRIKTRYSSKSHTQLTDEVQLRPFDRGTPAYEVDARKSNDVFKSSTESHQIKKTMQIDLDSV